MESNSFSRRIRFVEVLVVVLVLFALGALLMPALLAKQEAERSRVCQDKIKAVALAILNHESARNHFPLITSRDKPQLKAALSALPASANPGDTEAGWSWVVQILPYLDKKELYSVIVDRSSQFSIERGPFDPAIRTADPNSQHCSSVVLPELICPSWTGNENTHGHSQIDTVGVTSGAPEYADIDSNAINRGQSTQSGANVAPTNYKPIVGTHMVAGAPLENGAMILTGEQGTTISAISDGTSKTILLVETKECGYASWYDGTLNWLVTNNPNAKTPPGTGSGDQAVAPWINAELALNVGPKPSDKTPVYYLPNNLTTNWPRNSINWGPSSEHSRGMIMHVFADCHVQVISILADPQAILNLTTRAGSESITCNLISGPSVDDSLIYSTTLPRAR